MRVSQAVQCHQEANILFSYILELFLTHSDTKVERSRLYSYLPP